MSKGTNSGISIGFTGLLVIAFIVLRLCKQINWSWWLILSPIWGYAGIIIFFFLLSLIIKSLINIQKEKYVKNNPDLFTPKNIRMSKLQERIEIMQKNK